MANRRGFLGFRSWRRCIAAGIAYPALLVMLWLCCYAVIAGGDLDSRITGTLLATLALFLTAVWQVVLERSRFRTTNHETMFPRVRYGWSMPLAPSVLCLLALASTWPTGFYLLLRATFFVAGAFLAWVASEHDDRRFVVVLGLLAVLFNPLIPLYLHSRPLWLVLDLLATGILWIAVLRFGSLEYDAA